MNTTRGSQCFGSRNANPPGLNFSIVPTTTTLQMGFFPPEARFYIRSAELPPIAKDFELRDLRLADYLIPARVIQR